MNTGKKLGFTVLAFGLVLTMLACNLASSTQKPATGGGNSTDVPANAPTSAAIVSDPETTINNVLKATTQAPPYHASLTITSNGATTQIEADVILPDNFHVTTTHDGKTSEFIAVGSNSYNKVNGAWVASPFDIADLTAGFTDILGKDTTLSDVKFVKADIVNGKPALVYSFTAQYNTSGLAVNSATTMWVDATSALPVKMVIDSDANGIKSHTEETLTYDPNITIEAPAP